MTDLRDRQTWEELLGPLMMARMQFMERAARSDPTEHGIARGKLEGLEHAMALLKDTRARLVRETGDVLQHT